MLLQLYTFSTWHDIDLKDPTLSIELTGVLFNPDKGGVYSYPFTIDIDENIAAFGSSAEVYGDSLYTILHDAKARIVAGGVPILQGKVDLDKSVDIKLSDNGHRTIEIKIVSRNKSYEKKIDGIRLRDLDVRGQNIQIGYAFPKNVPIDCDYTRKEYRINGSGSHRVKYNGITWDCDLLSSEEKTGTAYFAMPYYLFTHIDKDIYADSDCPNKKITGWMQDLASPIAPFNFTNVQEAYDPLYPEAHPYCNVRACYDEYQQNDDEWEKRHNFCVSDPDRVNSAPCFYIGYVFDLAMRQIKMPVTTNALNDIIDYRRMAFWHADPQFKVSDTPVSSTTIGMSGTSHTLVGGWFNVQASYKAGQQYNGNQTVMTAVPGDDKSHFIVCDFKDKDGDKSFHTRFSLHAAYATADNLPDIEVKELIDDITTPFGGRVIYDDFTESISIILLRDVMRSMNTTTIPCELTAEPTKSENDIRGFRLRYSSANTISSNTVTKVKNETSGSDETQYNYQGYKNVKYLREDEEFADYAELAMSVSLTDENLYIDPVTGNKYRIKVDGDAKTQGDQFPSVFEVAGYHDVEIGDCTDKQYVEEVSIPFRPAISAVTNNYRIAAAGFRGKEVPSPVYAQYVEGEFHSGYSVKIGGNRVELCEVKYDYDNIPLERIYDLGGKRQNNALHIDVELTIRAKEVPAGSTDFPYFDNECENVIGIMRGSGATSTTIIYDDDFDGQGTARYMQTAGTDAEFFSDSVNHFGETFDYNGDNDGIGYNFKDAVSLKLQAETHKDGDPSKPYYDIDERFAKRGLYDKYYAEWAHFLIDHKVLTLPLRMELAAFQQLTLDTTRWYTFGDHTGLIKSGTAHVNDDGTVTLDLKIAYL